MTIHEDYFNLTLKWKREYGEKTIILMQVGSFYEVYALKDERNEIYGSNIVEYAKINDLVIANKQIKVAGPLEDVVPDKKNYDLVMAGFGLTQLDKYVSKLQNNGYTIVVYDQDIQGKNTTRSVSEIISPGTYFSPTTDNPSNHTMCIWVEKSRAKKKLPSQVTIGISWLDIFTGKTRISQITREYTHNPTTYDELERIVAINNPSECIIVSDQDEDFMDDIINFAGITSQKIHKICLVETTTISTLAVRAQKQTYQQSVFERFYPTSSIDHIISEMPTHILAIQSFVFLLDFIYTQNPNLVEKLALPLFESANDTLVLANHSLQQLNIIDEGRHSGKLSSVSSLLNHCVTMMGKRKFLYNLHNPITNIDELQSSYDITEHLLNNGSWNLIRHTMKEVHDIEKLKRKIIIKKITPKDLGTFYLDLQKIFSLDKELLRDEKTTLYIRDRLDCMRSMGNAEHLKGREINEICQHIMDDLDKNFAVDKCLEICSITPEYFGSLSINKLSFIQPGLCDQVDDLLSDCIDARNKLESIAQWLTAQIATMEKKGRSKTTSPHYIKIHETPKADPVLLGTKRRIKLLQEVLSKNKTEKNVSLEYIDFTNTKKIFTLDLENLEYPILGSRKQDLIVTSDTIKKLSSKIQRAESQLVNATLSYYRDYVVKFSGFRMLIEEVANFATNVDLLQCKCYIADNYNYSKPNIKKTTKSFFEMNAVRHPLIEHLQTKEVYVTNNIMMGNGTDGLLLYGTNAVGKTSLIKSIGINIIMAQAGLYVACTKLVYSPYQAIFTRILGNDNIFKGLSTFEVEMSELSTILKLSDENSLILGDELCSGTESDSALSIFTASLESLHKRRSTFLFATHFHEIQKYSEISSLERLTSKHMEVKYNREKDTLIYDRKLKDGPGDSMYGLEVCKSLHLPDEFLSRSHKIRNKYNKETRNVLEESGSRYNSQKLSGMCEICKKNRGSDTHHLQYQKFSDKKGFIDTFHKNHKANLVIICKECHKKIHKDDVQYKQVKTTCGYELQCI